MRVSSCVGMQEHTSMCIARVDGECYDSAIARGGSKLSKTEGVSLACGESKMSKTEVVSLRFARLRYVGGF